MTTTVLLDTHALHWWTADPNRLSPTATAVLETADELAVAAMTWYELAWLATRRRIVVDRPIRAWLLDLAVYVRTIGVSPAVAIIAAELPETFPGDPADRLIYATAIEHGLQLVTKDRRMHDHPQPRPITVW